MTHWFNVRMYNIGDVKVREATTNVKDLWKPLSAMVRAEMINEELTSFRRASGGGLVVRTYSSAFPLSIHSDTRSG